MFYPLQITVLAAVTVPLAMLAIVLGLVDARGKLVYRINQFWAWLILRVCGISLRITGLENVDPKLTYIFMANHQSNIDIPALIQGLSAFQLRWIAKRELLHVPLFGWAMWATKHVVVDRSDPQDAMRSLALAKARLSAGLSIVVFPEGTRSKEGRLLRFKKGGFLIAAETQAKIVPITINGSAEILPPGSWRLRPGIIEIVIGEPVPTDGYHPGNLRLLLERVRNAIAANLKNGTTKTSDPFRKNSPAAGGPTSVREGAR